MTDKEQENLEKEYLSDLMQLERLIMDRESVGHPGNYGLPDLLFPKGFHPGVYDADGSALVNKLAGAELSDGWMRSPLEKPETNEEYFRRQEIQLDKFVTENLFIIKDARKVRVRTIPILRKWICDVFFQRATKTITWKPRGGGGSLTAAVLIWLLSVYRKVSVVDIAGSADQSKIVYEYVTQFWDSIPGLKKGLLNGDPMVSLTRLKTGAEIKCVPATEKQARGKHYSTVFIDECCQEDPRVERAMLAAIQGALSEPDPIVCLFSTFHIPKGLFQEYWDGYEDKGFTRYHWNTFHTMQKCERGASHCTQEDPKGLEFCKQCYLTDKKIVKDISGEHQTERWTGCFGTARDSEGWSTFENICSAKKINIGSSIFECEYACFLGDTPVMTERGWVPIQDILEGEMVLTARGNWKPCHPMSRWYSGDVYRVNPRGSFPVISTADHPFSVRKRLSGKRRLVLSSPSEWVLAKDLTTDHFTRFPKMGTQVAEKFKYTRRIGGRKVREKCVEIDRGYNLGLFLGLFLGDGYFEFRRGVPAIIGFSESSGKGNTKLYTSLVRKLFGRKPTTRGTLEILTTFGDVGLAEYLCSFGRYSSQKRLPSILFRSMSQEEARGFLYGMFLTDGSYDESRSYVRFGTTSSGLAGNVYSLLVREGFNPSVHKEKPGTYSRKSLSPNEAFVTGISGDGGQSFYDWMTSGSSVRNSSYSPVHREDDGITSVLSSIEGDDYSGVVYNLEVEDDNTYVAGGMVVHNCERPQYSSAVYPPELIEESVLDPILIDPNVDKPAVGIDWGIQTAGSLAITLAVRKLEYIYVSEIIYTDHTLVSDVADLLNGWRKKFGEFPVIADSSHPFNNAELTQAGFDVRPVSFGTWKKIGIENVSKYFVFRRLKINSTLQTLIDQLKAYRRNATTGGIVKKEDHGPDSLMCVLLNFRFEDEFGPDIQKAAVLEEQTRLMAAKEMKKDNRAFDSTIIDSVVAKTYIPQFIPESALGGGEQKNVISF